MKCAHQKQYAGLEGWRIEILYNTETVEVVGEDAVEAVKVKNNQTEKALLNAGFFVAIGHSNCNF